MKTSVTTQTPTRLAKQVPPEVREILGPPPILSTEDSTIYYATLAWFAKDLQPDDLITWLLVKDLADYRVEIARYRRFKAALLRQNYESYCENLIKDAERKLADQLKELRKQAEDERRTIRSVPQYDVQKIECEFKLVEQRYAESASSTQKEHDQRIAQIEVRKQDGPSDRYVVNNLEDWVDTHDRVDAIQQAVEQKFYATLREIERYKFGLGKALRAEIGKVIDGDFSRQGEAGILVTSRSAGSSR
jgi:hypothetical protein